jgi:hypothetical protein
MNIEIHIVAILLVVLFSGGALVAWLSEADYEESQ